MKKQKKKDERRSSLCARPRQSVLFSSFIINMCVFHGWKKIWRRLYQLFLIYIKYFGIYRERKVIIMFFTFDINLIKYFIRRNHFWTYSWQISKDWIRCKEKFLQYGHSWIEQVVNRMESRCNSNVNIKSKGDMSNFEFG
jgi:hypothetical protein